MREPSYTRLSGISNDDLVAAIMVLSKAVKAGKIVVKDNYQLLYLNYHLPAIGSKIYLDNFTTTGLSVAMALSKFVKSCGPEQKVYLISLNEVNCEATIK